MGVSGSILSGGGKNRFASVLESRIEVMSAISWGAMFAADHASAQSNSKAGRLEIMRGGIRIVNSSRRHVLEKATMGILFPSLTIQETGPRSLGQSKGCRVRILCWSVSQVG